VSGRVPRSAVTGYREAYALVRQAKADFRRLLVVEPGVPGAAEQLRWLGEMILVRHFDDWLAGDPRPNVARAIRRFCARLARPKSRPSSSLQFAAAMLCWSYVELGMPNDHAFLLLEHVMHHVAPAEGDPLRIERPWPELEQALAQSQELRRIPELGLLSPEERGVWNEILRWEVDAVGSLKPSDEQLAAMGECPQVAQPDRVMRLVAGGLGAALDGLRDTAGLLVRDDALLAEARSRGYSVSRIEELRQVPLEVLDELSGRSLAAGKLLGTVQGTGTGAGGIFASLLDVPTLLLLNLRFIAQIAHTYGFETTAESEQAFVLNVLGVASAAERLRGAFVANLNRLAAELAVKGSVKQLDHLVFRALLAKVAQSVGVRLSEGGLARIVPLVGAIVGGAVNYAYTRDNLVAARMMYRKRWLLQQCVVRSPAWGARLLDAAEPAPPSASAAPEPGAGAPRCGRDAAEEVRDPRGPGKRGGSGRHASRRG
jgi:hypothetical protein